MMAYKYHIQKIIKALLNYKSGLFGGISHMGQLFVQKKY